MLFDSPSRCLLLCVCRSTVSYSLYNHVSYPLYKSPPQFGAKMQPKHGKDASLPRGTPSAICHKEHETLTLCNMDPAGITAHTSAKQHRHLRVLACALPPLRMATVPKRASKTGKRPPASKGMATKDATSVSSVNAEVNQLLKSGDATSALHVLQSAAPCRCAHSTSLTSSPAFVPQRAYSGGCIDRDPPSVPHPQP